MYTTLGWLVGTLHLPEKLPLLEFLNAASQTSFAMTDVVLGETNLPFLALQRHSVIVVLTEPDELIENIERSSARTTIHSVSCFFEKGMVMGSLMLPSGTRVSDELLASPGFFVVGRCTIGIDADETQMEAHVQALLNATHVVGVAEMKT